MSPSAPLWSLDAAELGPLFRAGEASPTQALEACLARLAAVNPLINAVVTLDEAGARKAAAASTERYRGGRPLGPLDGVPVTVKDNLYVGGLRATWGSLLFADHVAPQDDLAIARLRAAGAVILGKTNTPELALAGYTDNRLFGPTGNPWAPALTPGGSSGGAVAGAAAGIAPLAVATDAGGSTRRPAGHAGVAGLRPGLGRVPRRYGFPALAQDFQTIGPVARSIADLRLAFSAMADPPPRGAPPPEARALRIAAVGGIPGSPVEPAVAASFEGALELLRSLGHVVQPIEPPWDGERVNAVFTTLASVGVARVVAGHSGWQEKVTPAIAALAEAGMRRPATDYALALDEVLALRWRFADLFQEFDALATPTAAALPWPKAEPYPKRIGGVEAGPRASAVFTTVFNMAGLPGLSVPAAPSPEGLPIGLQLAGPRGSEERLLALAEAFEAARPWTKLAPLEP